MEIINLIGKTVTVVDENGRLVESFQPDGHAICEVSLAELQRVGGVVITTNNYGKVQGLPPQDPYNEKYYIVDENVAEATKHSRYDLLVLDQITDRSTKNTQFCRALVNIM